MKLRELLPGVPLPAPPECESREILGLTYDSRLVGPGFLFFAFPGAKADGRAFAIEAVERGAVAVVSESPAPSNFPAPWIQVPHGRQAMSHASRIFYDWPDRSLSLVGVTGTNGKTTTVFCIDAMLRNTGLVTGMVGTVVYRIAGEERPAVNTTPDSIDLMQMMAATRDAGGLHFSFEVSSHALALRRVSGLDFHTAVFTNFTRDHLDFHDTMDKYFAAKEMLLTGTGGKPPKYAVLNADDARVMQARTQPETKRVTYGFHESADVRAENLDAGFHGLRFDIRHAGGVTRLESPLVGLFNVHNLLAAFAAGLTLGLSAQTAAIGLAACKGVPGRFERVDEGQPFLVVVDYAHTDDALRNVIQSARALNPKRVITLFGCGGDRDRAKRPLMGETAAGLSDYVIVTSDNPRSEDPLDIINDALVGVRRTDKPHFVEPDRAKAIRRAIEEARAGDIVLIAGKGHEPYQVLADRTIEFDDRETARAILRSFGYRAAGTGA